MTFNNQDEEINYLIQHLKELSKQKYGIVGNRFEEDISKNRTNENALNLYDMIMPILYSRGIPIEQILDYSIINGRMLLSILLF